MGLDPESGEGGPALFLQVSAGHRPTWLQEVVSPQGSRRLPVVLTRQKVKTLLEALRGTNWLIASLLDGAGMRVIEGLRLRVKELDLERGEAARPVSRSSRNPACASRETR
ncbi:hypothetical protein FHP08_15545 [Zeimonas arvi]|uniref:Tyr recombinase domain-containing protein n=1 Tax=Zeimonas arvi TaxID=2498847 RepID=A0A5C8NSK3_9BURK|nr:hypothetical protein FHP08_15545 [Zeimonas arvi]